MTDLDIASLHRDNAERALIERGWTIQRFVDGSVAYVRPGGQPYAWAGEGRLGSDYFWSLTGALLVALDSTPLVPATLPVPPASETLGKLTGRLVGQVGVYAALRRLDAPRWIALVVASAVGHIANHRDPISQEAVDVASEAVAQTIADRLWN